MFDPGEFERRNRRFLIAVALIGAVAILSLILIALRKSGQL